MNTPTTKANGSIAASSKYKGEQAHIFNARLTPKSVELSVRSRDRWMIVAIVAILVAGFFATIVALALILR